MKNELVITARGRLLVRLTMLITLGLVFSFCIFVGWKRAQPRYDGYFSDMTSNPVVVTMVFDDSPASKAGLKIGDSILSINNIPVEEIAPIENTGFPHDVWQDETQLIVYEREGVENSLVIETERWQPLFILLGRWLFPLIVIGYCFFHLFLWVRKPYDLNVLLYVGSQIALASFFAMQPYFVIIIYIRVIPLMLTPVFLIHLHSRLTNQPHPMIRWFYLIPFSMLGVGIFIYANSRQRSFEFLRASSGLFLGLILISTIILLRGYFRGSLQIRRRLRFVVLGSGLVMLVFALAFVLPFAFLGRDTLFGSSVAVISLLLLPIAYGTAIYRDGFIQLERIYNRAIVHLLAAAILLVVVLVGLQILTSLNASAWEDQPAVLVSGAVVVGLLFLPLRNRIGRILDQFLFDGWYDYRSVIDEMSSRLSSTVDEQELGYLLVDRLSELMHIKGAALLLPGSNWRTIRAAGQIPSEIAAPSTPFISAEPLDAVDPAVDLFVPLMGKDNIVGLMVLGPREGMTAYDETDRQILTTLANQASISAENIQLVHQLKNRAEEVNRLYAEVVNSREVERKRLARDLHDRAIQDMIHLKHIVSIGLTNANAVDVIENEMQGVIDDLRQITTDLRPPELDVLGLQAAIDNYLQRISAETGLDTHLSGENDPALIPPEISTALYRVFQEALNNVRRHAQATRVDVSLSTFTTMVKLQILDNGVGLNAAWDANALTAAGHFGVAGMREQMDLIGGQLEIVSAEPNGTIVTATAPLPV